MAIEFNTTKERLLQDLQARLSDLRDRRPLHVLVKELRSKRSAGPDSQNNHLHGHLRQLSDYSGYALSYLKMWVMAYAMLELDYPDQGMYGLPVPKPDSEASPSEFAKLIDAVHMLADGILPGGRDDLREDE